MADTIDRIQVEFSINYEDFMTRLSGIESGVDSVAKTFGTVESASVRYASAMDTTATATTAAVSSINEYTTAAVTQADAARTAAAETANQGKKSAEAFQSIKEGFAQIKTVLGMLGVSVGLGALISQVKELGTEAEAAGKAYGKMYNTIYYTIGELTGTQKELAESLRLEGFDTTAVAETVSRLTALFPDAESTVLENGKTALEEMAEEVLWMDRKGYGDVSELIDGMNDAFKKWSVPSADITGELGYLAAAYRDTNTDVSTLLSSLTRLDEVGTTLGLTFRDMVDFIGAANVAGNLDDLSNVGMRFESQYTSRVSDIYTALLDADRETLVLAGVGTDEAESAIQQVIDALAVDESSAKMKAQELAGTIVTAIFREANQQASAAATQAQASQIWADALDIEVGRISNRLADLSLSAVRGYENIRTANRDVVTETGQTTTILVKIDKGLGTSDYAAKTEAAKEDALRSTWHGTRTPQVEMQTAAYIDEGRDYWSSYALANVDVELARLGTYLLAGNALLSGLVSGLMQQTAEPAADDTGFLETVSEFFAQLSPIGTASAAEPVAIAGDSSATDLTEVSPVKDLQIQADAAEIVSADASAGPAISVSPEISVNPSVSVSPEVTVDPTVSVYPQISVTPDFSMQTEPQILLPVQEPAVQNTSVNPSVSVSPEVTATPTVSVYPQISVTPDFSMQTEPQIRLPVQDPAVQNITIDPSVSVSPEIAVEIPEPAETMSEFSLPPENPEAMVDVVQESAEPPAVSVMPEIAVAPEISVNPAVSVFPEITVDQEPAKNQPVSVTPAISVYPDISLHPVIETAAEFRPDVSVIPEISMTPELGIEPFRTETEDESGSVSILSTLASFFDRLRDSIAVPDIAVDIPEPVSVPVVEEPQEDTASPVSAVVGSLLSVLESGNSALTDSISALNSLIAQLAGSLAKNGEVTVIQNISAPVADSYAIRNAAAAGISAAQAGSFRL